MVDILYCEFFKLKRSKMLLISILGQMVAPIMVFVGLIKARIRDPQTIITYGEMLEQTNLYVLMLFGVVVYGAIVAYLFSREYTENTLKSVLSLPVSKISFVIGKFLMFFIWIMILTVVAWSSTLFLSIIGSATNFSLHVIIESLKQYFIGAVLLFLTMSPFVFITLWFKNLIPPVIAGATVAMINVALSNEDLAVLFPWSSPYLIASGKIVKYQYPESLALLLIVITFLLGFVASLIYFKKEDVK